MGCHKSAPRQQQPNPGSLNNPVMNRLQISIADGIAISPGGWSNAQQKKTPIKPTLVHG
jgi:hypothetical protein